MLNSRPFIQRRQIICLQTDKRRLGRGNILAVFGFTRRCDKFIGKLKAMQDALGDLNDIKVHEGLASETLPIACRGAEINEPRARKAFAAGRLFWTRGCGLCISHETSGTRLCDS
jgi:hypothetical protein